MKRGSYAAGVIFASLAAGPVFLMSMTLAMWADQSPTTYAYGVDTSIIVPGISIMCISVIFGFMISVIPNLAGCWFMHGIGIGNTALRLPVSWALAGGGFAGLPFLFLEPASRYGPPMGFVFGLTGAGCALIARKSVRWDDRPHPSA